MYRSSWFLKNTIGFLFGALLMRRPSSLRSSHDLRAPFRTELALLLLGCRSRGFGGWRRCFLQLCPPRFLSRSNLGACRGTHYLLLLGRCRSNSCGDSRCRSGSRSGSKNAGKFRFQRFDLFLNGHCPFELRDREIQNVVHRTSSIGTSYLQSINVVLQEQCRYCRGVR